MPNKPKHVPSVVLKPKTPDGAHISSAGAVKLVKKKPPQIHIETKVRMYQDFPGFGFDLLEITIDGKTVEVYRACNFANNNSLVCLPMNGGVAFFSEAQADAYKEQVKAETMKKSLVLPGSPDFKPPILH